MNGWIKLHYKFLKWEWSNDANMVALFLHLLLKANYQGRNWRGQDIKRGELITGLHSLSAETGISLQSLRTCLKRLKSTNEITIKTTNKYSVICIRNYNKYQHELTSKLTSKLTNNQQTTNKQLTTPKEYKKGNNKDNNIYVSFLKHFNETIGRNFRGCAKSKRNFYARIEQGYTIKDFQKAVVSAKADKFHVDNDYKYITPEFITRQDKLDRYINQTPKRYTSIV
mgnify:CR=1 FL=1